MAFKTFAPGVLTSSDVNTFLMRQAVITCTSTTRPASPSEGMTIYETDTDCYKSYDGSAWVNLADAITEAHESYTPTIASVGGTQWQQGDGTVTAKFTRLGRLVIVRVRFVLGSTTTIGTSQALSISLPTTARNTQYFTFGGGIAVDSSTGYPYEVFCSSNGTNAFAVFALQSSVGFIEAIITSKPFTWAAGDDLQVVYMYEEA